MDQDRWVTGVPENQEAHIGTWHRGPGPMISRRPGRPPKKSGSFAGAGRILLFGALGMLLVSAVLGATSGGQAAAGSGAALRLRTKCSPFGVAASWRSSVSTTRQKLSLTWGEA